MLVSRGVSRLCVRRPHCLFMSTTSFIPNGPETAALGSSPSEPLDIRSFAADPFEQFKQWFAAAQKAMTDPHSMTLATCGSNGLPSARIVLLRHFSPEGFTFFTCYESQKGRQIEQNPNVALVFHWPPLSRQVRIEGTVRHCSPATSDEYWNCRPRESRKAACASMQSEPVADRASLLRAFQEVDELYPDSAGADIPRPPRWGGYVVTPRMFEFWQSGNFRMHSRIQYQHSDGQWNMRTLQP
eukprot:gnl/Spiro4/10375_TR5547_c0_g1_i2.p2 gnl/Spiro4/10375_TR5547_c0_g1~~gnl/Spiro4/10375_TR5547_c0_g1_i2.p2  ORF type:complete len:242 (+),score=68.74 gnl/Spiro4/10375_TR5547_c0_g1_i2:57-782(+)